MSALENKVIILGISAGIAAYKTVDLVSQLTKLGAEVHVVTTTRALDFVSPLSLEIMSGNPVHCCELQNNNSEIGHISLASKADLVLIAPATANTIAKLVTGIADELIFDVVLATQAPVLVAPAMNTNMWEHSTVQRNIQVLNSMNYEIIEPEIGDLACKTHGQGRLASTENIINAVINKLGTNSKKSSRVLL